MKRNHSQPSGPSLVLLLLICLLSPPLLRAQPVVHYSTSFEPAEGYDPAFELVGQKGWIGEGTGGNGLLLEAFPGFGQQAFIGFYPPLDTNSSTTIWHPSGLETVNVTNRIVQFSVLMQIVGSTNNQRDDFRWSAYNTAGHRLFSLDFDTANHGINYILDDEKAVFTGFTFDSLGTYDLHVNFNFAQNHWSATLNGFVIVNSKPITTQNAARNLGDVDAVWLMDPAKPGNNYMVFDDYRIASDTKPTIPPVLEPLRMEKNGEFYFLVHGEEGVKYDIEVTSDFKNWFLLLSIVAPAGGTFEFHDTTSPGQPRSFYSARQSAN